MNELVSVIITTYNRLEWLKKAINSVQEQSYPNIEIIVVDSSETAKTKDYILKNENIIYAHSGINHPNVMRNLGIQCSNGTWIAFLDDDDTWDKEKIAKQVKCFKKYNIGLCYTGKNIINQNNEKIKYSYKKGFFKTAKQSIGWDNFIGITSSMMIKKNIVSEVGDLDESFPALQDYEFSIRICQKYDVKGINEPLVNYRYQHHETQVSINNENFKKACTMLKNKYPENCLLKFGLWKLKIKRRIKKLYE